MIGEIAKRDDLMPTQSVLDVLDTLTGLGHEAYLVGGGVRDRLLGRAVSDWDITTSALPEEVQSAFERVVPTGLQHGTVTVVLDGEPIEVTTYRVDGAYIDGRRPSEIKFTRSLIEDLSRRDFTVNAMAWSPADNVLIDPFDGQGDLKRGIIRAVGHAKARLTEDGLRSMRAIRFAAVLDFELEVNLQKAIRDTKDTFSKVSVERMAIELRKMMTSEKAGWGLGVMRRTGLLDVVLSSVATLGDASFERLCECVDAAPADYVIRMALALTKRPDTARATLEFLKSSRRDRDRIGALVDLSPAVNPFKLSRLECCRLAASVGRDEWENFMAFKIALHVGSAANEVTDWRALELRLIQEKIWAGPLVVKDLAISGRDVLSVLDIPPSKRVARLLNALLAEVWSGALLNESTVLLQRLPSLAAQIQS